MLGVRSAAAVRPGDDFEKMSVGIVEIDAATVVPSVDLARLPMEGIGPIANAAFAQTIDDAVELAFRDEKREMARGDLPIGLQQVERGRADLDNNKVRQATGGSQTEDIAQEFGRLCVVARIHDGMVQGDRHGATPSSSRFRA
jgi:hypothetical protein